MKLRLTLSITAALTLCSIQASDWRIHPTFDGEINYMVDTPSFTYFTGKVLPDNNFFPTSHSLFRYDKEGRSFSRCLRSISCRTILSVLSAIVPGVVISRWYIPTMILTLSTTMGMWSISRLTVLPHCHIQRWSTQYHSPQQAI